MHFSELLLFQSTPPLLVVHSLSGHPETQTSAETCTSTSHSTFIQSLKSSTNTSKILFQSLHQLLMTSPVTVFPVSCLE